MTTATIGERGQITIPKQYRSRLGLYPRMVLTFRISGNALIAEKSEKRNPFDEFRGYCKFPDGVHSTDELVRDMRGC